MTANGAAYCWGYGGYGELGNDTSTSLEANSPTPGAVLGLLTFATVSAGDAVACGLTTGSAAYCWGNNGNGELGNGTTMFHGTPVAVSGGLTFAAISAGERYACAVTPSGTAYCWGRNDIGQLGNGTSTNSAIPVAVSGGLMFAAVSASSGSGQTCGVTPSGAAYCWGNNSNGQLGNSTTANSTTPVAVW